ncbi:unnamed protein product, partial [Rotaria sp. Silwood2]
TYTTDTPYGKQITMVMMPFQISALINSQPYPPKNIVGPISDHDRPYSKYGHLDEKIFSRRFRFDVSGLRTLGKRLINKCRMARRMYAISCHTSTSKENILMEICRQFPLQSIQYICISMDRPQIITTTTTTTANGLPTVYIQIILKKVVNKKLWFLDKVTDREFMEIGDFKSPKARSKPGAWSSSEFIRAQKRKNKINN